MTTRWLVAIMGVIGWLGACASRQPVSAEKNEMSLSCNVLVIAPTEDVRQLIIELHNPSAEPLAVRYFEPYIDFDVVAADGSALDLSSAAINVPSRPRSLALAPGGSERVPVAVKLRFGPPGETASGKEIVVRSAGARPALAIVARFGEVVCGPLPLESR